MQRLMEQLRAPQTEQLPSYNSITNAANSAAATAASVVPRGNRGPNSTAQRRKGMALTAASAVAFAVMALLVQVLDSRGYTALQTMFWRGVVQSIGALVVCLVRGVQPLRVIGDWKRFRWVLMRAVFGSIGHVLYYMALARMAMGTATVLFFTNPLFTAAFARWLLHEPLPPRAAWLMAGALGGVVLVAAPLSPLSLAVGAVPLQWALLALLGAASTALAYTSIRIAGRLVHPMVHVMYFGVIAAVGALVLSRATGQPWKMPENSLAGWAPVAGVGVSALTAQFLMNWGLQLAHAAPVVMVRNSTVAISFVLDIIVYQTVPSLLGTVGAVLITVCAILISR
ncbi:hypothetical protein H4R20_000657 [Coemansia guatemalensis]|uniref:EamA domain-containing protein n=1 Tax=Coemansia guatemalensis TaxID=2761395 RepID=A0A9W8I0Q2_9FUNG|nr:hypothetical protein H4R20_000657 [Coemansia guatemalensis]